MVARSRDPVSRSAAGRNWKREYEALAAEDRRVRLDAVGLEQLGMAAYLAGDEAASFDALTRAHTLALEHGETREAARAAFWLAFALIGAREMTRAGGWAARARRLLEEGGHDCVECGYVLLPQALGQAAAGDLTGADATFAAAERVGRRFTDADLLSLARQGRGRVFVALGRVPEGVALFDEVMVAVTAGEVTPVVAGVVYCSVISACFELLDVRRAREWTEALTAWCEAQPGLVPYRGECLAYRAELFRLRGRWPDAVREAQQAREVLGAVRGPVQGAAAYALAEVHRLRGEIAEAEAAYQRASEYGRPAYPGLALLRLAQGQHEAARAAMDRVLLEPLRGRQRAEVLAAGVEVLVASGDVEAARRRADELDDMARAGGSEWLQALAASASGSVHLARGEARHALGHLRTAAALWSDLDAPYEAARAKVLIGRACHALGDTDGARMEWDAAAAVFRECRAGPALAEVDQLRRAPSPGPAAAGGLTPREVEVLRLIARGRTNREIARELDISEKTVARHVSNIFTKLDVPTRAAATAYAFTHGLAP